MEARVGFEPTNRGFADPSLSHLGTAPFPFFGFSFIILSWSGRWDLNPRPSAWQADVLPLNYARFNIITQYKALGLNYQKEKILSNRLDYLVRTRSPIIIGSLQERTFTVDVVLWVSMTIRLAITLRETASVDNL